MIRDFVNFLTFLLEEQLTMDICFLVAQNLFKSFVGAIASKKFKNPVDAFITP